MKPLDPRLLRRAAGARLFLLGGGAIGFVQTLAVIVFAWSTAQAVSRAIDGAALDELAPLLAALAVAVVVRGTCIWATDAAAAAASSRVKGELRAQAVDAAVRLGPGWAAARGTAALATVLGMGLDALDAYFGKYVPQLILTVIATPVLVLVMLVQDPLSGIIVIITLPLIPVFMILIGWATQAAQKRSWSRLQLLSAAFLDVVGGLGTLKIFGRQHRQAARIAAVTDEYRRDTMSVLRISFLSGFVLELAASLSVAIVAVQIGLRLLDGAMPLSVGLFVLLLAPEAFLPVRGVGVQFHAAADGLAAADDVLGILDDADEASAVPASSGPVASSRSSRAEAAVNAASPAGLDARPTLEIVGLSVEHDGVRVLDGFTAEFAGGTVTAVTGPSGAGKSTLLTAIAGLDGPIRAGSRNGGILLDGRPIERADVAWSGQQPGLVSGTVAANVALGDSAPDHDRVASTLVRVGLHDVDPSTGLGVGGAGLSGGQAQRVAIARALYRAEGRGCPILLLDEPSSALDAASEQSVIEQLRSAAASGAIVIVVTHRPAVIAAADDVIRLEEVVRV
ncbi:MULTISPECIES: thiol reductant ABC exporter subunit CydD [unclassified Leifsonia]|uniref:thiol reductant ABC exporter subunit CydD n=1 Tax=unclassified Leifsonia TaxID=2663824 RepID=UPI0006F9D891|nr:MULTISPECIES: thiol reductant ABC exporter subunit CydD [unclassified Leifsonia]KQX07112.1 ABC transporter ATP-binding protein [Leifsonia sp. Root1293]KRA11395.1 ABC transporter ATP-binding protein [Leifsonia sp. Root60]